MISLTETAAQKITKTIQRRGHGIGIRVGVKTTGCSGLAYVLEYVDTVQPDDICIDSDNCKLFVDPKHLPYLDGMLMDYKRQGLNEGFEFINKNERDRCGCGLSFRI